MKPARLCAALWLMGLIGGCTDGREPSDMNTDLNQSAPADGPSDPYASKQAAALFNNLQKFAGRGVLFGHHETLAYGIGWKDRDLDSDILQVCGDFPAVFGWDLGEIGSDNNINNVPFEKIKNWVQTVYAKNGINTFSWHMRHPGTGKGSWDTTPVVNRLLPGGDLHEPYKAMLDRAAAFLDMRGPEGEPIPMILRLFHEHNGHWFWWSQKSCTADEFIRLWRFTVDYFRYEKQMHQFLYAYSPDVFRTAQEYLDRYPGDEYVDVLGMDDYRFFKSAASRDRAVCSLEILADLADQKGKIAALTETGVERMPDPAWFTQVLLSALNANERTRRIVWVALWRNESRRHFFATWPQHKSAEDFRAFYDDPFTVFLSELPPMYR